MIVPANVRYFAANSSHAITKLGTSIPCQHITTACMCILRCSTVIPKSKCRYSVKVSYRIQIASGHSCYKILSRYAAPADESVVYIWRSVEKNGPFAFHYWRPLKVIGTYADQSATCDFLLVICSNHGWFPTLTAISVESHIQFSHQHVFNAHVDGLPLGFCNGCGA